MAVDAPTVDDKTLRQLLELAADDGRAYRIGTPKRRPPRGRPPHPPRTLTVAMATYDDYDGVYFTVQALRMYHREVLDRISILVLDNNPSGPAAWPMKQLEQKAPEMRYVPCSEIRGTAVRDLLFSYSTSEWVMVVDSHVLLAPGALTRLLEFLDAHPECDDLLQGPTVWDELDGKLATHFEPAWRAGMYGTWGVDDRGLDPAGDPFEIPMQGLGCFVARRESWLGFNPRFSGFGGEEWYIHEKYRRHGRRTLCLPFLQWVHRFQRPDGVKYPNRWADRIRNYLIGWRELGLDDAPVLEHFRVVVGDQATDRVVAELAAEERNPFSFFDTIYCINLDRREDRWQRMQRRFHALGIAARVRRLPAVETPRSHHIGCALSHRRAIELARLQGLENVLVIEDDAVFVERTVDHLRRSLDELAGTDWEICYLGGHRWGTRAGPAPGYRYLEIPERITCTQAIAYHRRVFDQILGDLPPTIPQMRVWRQRHRAIDQYLGRRLRDRRRFVTVPAVATQPNIRNQEDPVYRDAYVI